jgi:hypothetical protein
LSEHLRTYLLVSIAFQDTRDVSNIRLALTLLFLARWMHRDVSAGNIILVRSGRGVRGKLSDLEYAQDFNEENRAVGTDPKTVRLSVVTEYPVLTCRVVGSGNSIFYATRDTQ